MSSLMIALLYTTDTKFLW